MLWVRWVGWRVWCIGVGGVTVRDEEGEGGSCQLIAGKAARKCVGRGIEVDARRAAWQAYGGREGTGRDGSVVCAADQSDLADKNQFFVTCLLLYVWLPLAATSLHHEQHDPTRRRCGRGRPRGHQHRHLSRQSRRPRRPVRADQSLEAQGVETTVGVLTQMAYLKAGVDLAPLLRRIGQRVSTYRILRGSGAEVSNEPVDAAAQHYGLDSYDVCRP